MENILQATPEYVNITKEATEHYMKLAAKIAGFNIGAKANSGASWYDCH